MARRSRKILGFKPMTLLIVAGVAYFVSPKFKTMVNNLLAKVGFKTGAA